YHKWHSPNGIQTAATVTVSPSANGSDDVRTDLILARLTSVLTNNTVNEFRFQWGRDFEFEFPNAPGPSVFWTNGVSFGQPNFLPRPAFPNEKKFQITDNYSFSRGNHSIKAGMDIVHYNELLINLFNGGGVYSYSNSFSFNGVSSQLNALAADCPPQASGCVPVSDGTKTGKHYSSFAQAFDLTGQSGRSQFTTTNYNFYIQDNWRARPNLTLYMGVRYEYQHMPPPGATNPLVPLTGQINQDTNNWAPRVGFSWDMFGNHKTVLRGGYGIYYGITSSSYISSAITGNGITQVSLSLSPTRSTDLPLAPVFPNILSNPSGVPGAITVFSPDFVEPLIHSADLTIEHELANGLTVSGSYLFSRGLHLFTTVDLNLPPAVGTVTYILPDGTPQGPFTLYQGARPNAAVGAIIEAQSVANSEYHGFVFSLNKRFSHGVQIQSNFTLAKAIDNGQTSSTFIPTFPQAFDQNNRGLEKGLSQFDTRKRWVTNFVVAPSINRFTDNAAAKAVFNDWQFSGVLTLSDGHALTPNLSGGSVGLGGTNGSNGSFRVPFLAPGTFVTPGFAALDMRFARNFKVGEKAHFQFIWEGFNIFNRVNYTGFISNLYSASSKVTGNNSIVTLSNPSATSAFLTPTADSSFFNGPREFQLGLKFIW
ncbi:MAG: TonB-dependent receptor, partial [Acidobacteriia bacterium]|nr:TonB-dependent receptor [Terriglobia bacterium]